LNQLLNEAHYAGISVSECVFVTKHRRVKGSDSRNPEYENYLYVITLKGLKKLYTDIHGRKFELPGISEREYLERKERNYAKQAARRGYTAAGD
jgi:hypothetical protein